MKYLNMQDILDNMLSFQKDEFTKSEYIDELFKLQKELVEIFFSDSKRRLCSLKYYHIVSEIKKECKKQNIKKNKVVGKLINYLNMLNSELVNQLEGARAEKNVKLKISKLPEPQKILNNVELANDEYETEIDDLVFDLSGITIIEVKAINDDVTIDEHGIMSTANKKFKAYPLWEKLDRKEYLLREVLKKSHYKDAKIKTLVCFTNPEIEVKNNCKGIKTCFIDELIQKLEVRYRDYSIRDMREMYSLISSASDPKRHQIEINIDDIKSTFAEVYLMLHKANEIHKEQVVVEQPVPVMVVNEPKKKRGLLGSILNMFMVFVNRIGKSLN